MEKITNGSAPGRVINVSSAAYAKGQLDLNDIEKSNLEESDEKLTELYYQSKLAIMLFTDSITRRFPNMTANALHPGVTKTSIGRYSDAPFYAVGMILYKPFQWFAMKTPRQGAQTSIYLSVASDVEGISGAYFDDCEEVSKVSKLCDCQNGDQLWEMSEQWTDLKERMDRLQEADS